MVMRSPTILIFLLPIKVVYNTQDLIFEMAFRKKAWNLRENFLETEIGSSTHSFPIL
jgi:hypothetical protein